MGKQAQQPNIVCWGDSSLLKIMANLIN